MALSWSKKRSLPMGTVAREFFLTDSVKALLQVCGEYLFAHEKGVDYYAFSARLGLSPHPSLEQVHAVRFLPEEAGVGSMGHYLVGISESEGRFVCPDDSIRIKF